MAHSESLWDSSVNSRPVHSLSCLPTSSSVCLVFFPLSLGLARWFWPDLMNVRHDHTTAVCVSSPWSGGLRDTQATTTNKQTVKVVFKDGWSLVKDSLTQKYNGRCLRKSIKNRKRRVLSQGFHYQVLKSMSCGDGGDKVSG